MKAKHTIFVSIIFITAIFKTLCAQNSGIANPKIVGMETDRWPRFNLFIYADNLGEFTAEEMAQWEAEIHWTGQKCLPESSTKETGESGTPLDLLMLIDNSTSMSGKFAYVEQAYKIFIDGLRKNSRVSIVRFQDRSSQQSWGSHLLAQSSNSRYYLKQQNIFSSLTPKTYLYDAVYQALIYFDIVAEAGQKSIVVFTDGADVGSATTWKALQQRAVDSGIPLFFVDFSHPTERNKDANNLSRDTHGFYTASGNPRELTDLYFDILRKINTQWVLRAAYSLSQSQVPPEGEITVRVPAIDALQTLRRTVKISPEKFAKLRYLKALQSETSLTSPSPEEANRWGIYQDDCWSALASAAIERGNREVADGAIAALEKSENVFSKQRGFLARIARAEKENSPELGDLYRTYVNTFKDGILSDEVLWKLVNWHASRSEEEQARQWAVRLLKSFPWSRYGDDALMALAQYEQDDNRSPVAETLYLEVKQFYREGDRYGESLLKLSELYIAGGAPEKAEEFLLSVEKEFPTLREGGQLYNQLILAQTLQNKYLAAAKTVDQFSQRMPESPELARARLTQASVYWKNLHQPEKAKEIYESLLQQENLDPALLAEVQQQYQQVQYELSPEQALRNRPPTDVVLVGLMSQHNWQVDPDLPEKFLAEAARLIREGRYEEALAITRAVAEQYPVIGLGDLALLMTSTAYHLQDSVQAQVEALGSIPEQYPASPLALTAKHHIARITAGGENQRDALRLYEELLAEARPEYAGLDSARTEYDQLRARALVIVSGEVQGISRDKIAEVTLVVHELPSQEVVAQIQPDAQANYTLGLVLGKQYTMIASAAGFLPLTMDLDFREVLAGQSVKKDLFLTRIAKGSRVTLNNVMFDLGSSDLREESMPTLDEMVRFLKNNPDLEVEIAGHTDNLGDPAFNEQLSLNRALSVARYLLENGVSMKSVTTNGYADRDPIASNDTREGRAQNRRVEMRVVR